MATQTALRRTIFRVAAVVAHCALNLPATAFERPQNVGYTNGASATPVQARRSPTVLEQARIESPALRDIVEEFASRDLGEGPAHEGLDDRTREIATAAAFAVLGNVEATKRHATYALRYGPPTAR
jgi:hypothetical protein